MMPSLLLSALLCLAAPAVGATHQTLDRGDGTSLAQEIDAYLQRLEAQGFSGGVLVTRGGEVVLSKGYGLADRARDIPFTRTTVFPVGSITKQFTGAAILKLEMQGKLRTGDPITDYFDGVPADKAGITLHHLLTHSSGLPAALGFDFARIERDAYVRQALDAPLQFEPGTRYAYSNVGYSLLAAVIEQVSGTSYDAFIRAHLFGPAGMDRTGYDLRRYASDDLAHGYREGEDWGTFADQVWADDGPYWHLRGNGGIHATLGDMHRWHQALTGEAVLSETAKEKYYTPYIREGEGASSYYGYGWVVEETDHGTLFWHDGGNPYFSNDFRRYVDAGVVIYVASNTAAHRAPRIMPDLAAIVFGEPYDLPTARTDRLTLAELGELPEGRSVRALLDMLAAGTDEAVSRFVEDHLAPGLVEKYGADELAEGFRGDQRRIGAVEVARISRGAVHTFELLVKSKATGQWRRLSVPVEPEPPHRLLGLGVDSASPPAGGGGAAHPASSSRTGNGEEAGKGEELAERLEAFLNDRVERDEFSGAVLVARDGHVLFERAYGLADRANGLPNRLDTRFNVGSMNKMFTALAIAQLAEQGKLSFDDRIIDHLPDYPNPEVAERVTLHHLLTHTSGLGFYPFDHGQRTPSGILPLFADAPLAFEPGSKMQYSNAGFVVLGLIVEEITGQSYYDYVREHILDPAGMTATGFFAQDADVPNRAIGYTRRGSDGPRRDVPRQPSTDRLEIKGSPAGGAYSTVRDMLRFAEALEHNTLLGPEMTTVLCTGKVEMGPGLRYAYGFGDHRRNGHRSIGHNGGAPGVGADFRLYPDLGYVTVVFTNYDPPAAMQVARKMEQLVTR